MINHIKGSSLHPGRTGTFGYPGPASKKFNDLETVDHKVGLHPTQQQHCGNQNLSCMSAALAKADGCRDGRCRGPAGQGTFGHCRAKSLLTTFSILGGTSMAATTVKCPFCRMQLGPQNVTAAVQQFSSASCMPHCHTPAHEVSDFSQTLASSTGRPVIVVAHEKAMPGEEAKPGSKSLGRLSVQNHSMKGNMCLLAVTGKVMQ